MAHERDAYNSPWTDAKQKAWDKAYKEVFSGGSNRINYATDQGTVGDPNYDPKKMTKYGANMFGVQPGTERWVGSQRGKAQVSGPVTVQPGAESTVATGARVPRPAETSSQIVGPDGTPRGNLETLTGDVRRTGLTVTSGYRDPHHKLSIANPHSAHSRNLAFDVRAKNARQADEAIAKIRTQMAARGLVEGQDYKILDEVRKPSAWATGPHVHTQLTPEGMKRYHANRPQAAPATSTATADEPKGQGALQSEPIAGQAQPRSEEPAAPRAPREQDVQQRVNLKVNDNEVQFARTSIKRQADREVREARWNSYSDIGAA